MEHSAALDFRRVCLCFDSSVVLRLYLCIQMHRISPHEIHLNQKLDTSIVV